MPEHSPRVQLRLEKEVQMEYPAVEPKFVHGDKS